ncbi:MAG: hypothetical protein ACXWCY_19100 [Burkholderiales bacterium]
MFMMPLHRAHRAPSQTLHEDREAVILADRLGFYDVFVGEHLTEKSENVTNRQDGAALWTSGIVQSVSLLLEHAEKKDDALQRHGVFKSDQSQDDSEITDDYVVDRLVICGSVNKVVDDILQLRERVGDFGEPVYANMDWVDPALARRSIELMATQAMPRVDQALGTAREKRAAGR